MTAEPAWPKRVTLVTELGASQRGGVWLADGATVTGDGDLNLDQGKVLSIATPTPGSLCEHRLRIVGDSYDVEGVSTTTFDYEPVP